MSTREKIRINKTNLAYWAHKIIGLAQIQDSMSLDFSHTLHVAGQLAKVAVTMTDQSAITDDRLREIGFVNLENLDSLVYELPLHPHKRIYYNRVQKKWQIASYEIPFYLWPATMGDVICLIHRYRDRTD